MKKLLFIILLSSTCAYANPISFADKDCNFSNKDMAGKNFSGVSFINCNMSGANLSGSNFKGAKLTNVDLSKANLRKVDFSDTTMVNVNMKQAITK